MARPPQPMPATPLDGYARYIAPTGVVTPFTRGTYHGEFPNPYADDRMTEWERQECNFAFDDACRATQEMASAAATWAERLADGKDFRPEFVGSGGAIPVFYAMKLQDALHRLHAVIQGFEHRTAVEGLRDTKP